MNDSVTSTYRMLKSSWGIWIQLTARIEDKNITGIPISNNIYLQIEIKNIKLSQLEINYLINGLKWISTQIEEQIDRPISIILEKIQIIYCDFQIEGLFYAIAFWASEYFNFEVPDYTCYFNKLENKYEFPDI